MRSVDTVAHAVCTSAMQLQYKNFLLALQLCEPHYDFIPFLLDDSFVSFIPSTLALFSLFSVPQKSKKA